MISLRGVSQVINHKVSNQKRSVNRASETSVSSHCRRQLRTSSAAMQSTANHRAEKLFPWPDKFKKSAGSLQDAVGPNTPVLFTPLKLRNMTLKNRIIVSPMCMYSSPDGFMTDFHLVHLGQFALGGAGLIITEATAVSPEGRISPQDNGLWKDEHMDMQRKIVNFVHENHGLIGIQLAHAGRKASTAPPFVSGSNAVSDADGGWTPVGASPIPWDASYRKPHELTKAEIKRIIDDFVAATKRADQIGYDTVEIHGAHGYLITSFYSPISNQRTDEYGGSFENRIRLLVEITKAVRAAWPVEKPLLVRVSASEWAEGGWTSEDTVKLAPILRDLGVDLLDVSSAGNTPNQKIAVGPGYQVPFSKAIKQSVPNLPTGTVGMISEPEQAEAILKNNDADAVLMARELLRDPHWPLRAARELDVNVHWIPQYERARRSPLKKSGL